MFTYILFTGIIFAWILLNANTQNLENTRKVKKLELLENLDTLFVGDSIDTPLFSLIVKENGLYFYQKFPNELIYKLDVPELYFILLLGDTLFFYNKENIEIKAIRPSKNNIITLDESYFLTISDGIIKISDSNGNLVNKI